MQIRRVDHNTYDVFGNTGFDAWTRVRRFHWGYKVVNGVELPREILRDVAANIAEHPNGSVNNL